MGGDDELVELLRRGDPEAVSYEPAPFNAIRERAAMLGPGSRTDPRARWGGMLGLAAAALVVAVGLAIGAASWWMVGVPPVDIPSAAAQGASLAPGSHDRSSPGVDQGGGLGREVFTFRTVAEMVATSDAVIKGTVTATRPGRSVGPIEELGRDLRYLDVDVSVDETLAGALDARNLTLEVDPVAFATPTAAEVFPKVGAEYVLFLHRRVDDGRYRPTNSQGVLWVDEGIIRSAVADPVGVSEVVDGVSVDSLIASVHDAVEGILGGEITPMPQALPPMPTK